jgi:hypothetical protein
MAHHAKLVEHITGQLRLLSEQGIEHFTQCDAGDSIGALAAYLLTRLEPAGQCRADDNAWHEEKLRPIATRKAGFMLRSAASGASRVTRVVIRSTP